MKQRFIKKLVLSKETVADLGNQELNAVKGGQVTKGERRQANFPTSR